MKGQFTKEHEPWNKGMKGIHLNPATEFKTGQNVMENHPSWKGGVHNMKSDCAYIMIASCKKVRRPRHIYEINYGSIPEGYVIYHKDGDKDNDNPSNLEAISRAALVKINNRR